MSSPAVVSSNGHVASSIEQRPGGPFASSINTTAKSSTPTVTTSSSAKKTSRKSEQLENNSNSNGTNFLPIAPHQTHFYSPANQQQHHPGLTLANQLQQQQALQSGGMAVFSSPNMMTTQQQGPQTTQLVVNAQGQHMQTFNTNAQGQLIQTGPGMGMIQGLQQMQMIAPGQQTYTMPIQHVYGHNMSHMQPIILTPGNLNLFQNNPSQLAIQIPNGNGTNTMITNQINNGNTPVKSGQQGQTIIKSVSMSPQQPQATKSSASTTPTANRGQAQPNQQQQTLIGTPTFQTTGTQNQTFVIGTYSQPNGQANGTIISTPNNRKNNGTASSARSSSTNTHKNTGANIIQKIQPATSLSTSPIIAPAQFKANNSPFQTASNGNSPANGQTIMVHGQGLQQGTGGLQLAPNQTIISSFNPGPITWTTGAINQQQTQLVAPNGQPIFIRSQTGDGQPQMFIQTANNQFQAVNMQMTQQPQQQGNAPGTIQMTSGHHQVQQMVTTSMNQSMSMMQANNHQTVAHAPMLQQSQQTTLTTMTGPMTNNNNNMNNMTSTVTSQSINSTTSTPLNNNAFRQRPIRPASNNSTSSTGKGKVSLDSRNANANIGGMQTKLAPKNSPVSSVGAQGNTTPTSNQQNAKLVGKLPLTMTKANDGTSATLKNASTMGTGATNTASLNSVNAGQTNKVGQKVGTFTSQSSALGASVMTSSALNVSSSGTVMTTSSSSTSLNPQQNRSASPATNLNKVNRKVERKDSSTGTTLVTKPIKSGLNGVRTSSGIANKAITSNSATNATHLVSSPNTQMINGVLCHLPANPQVKTPTNQKTPNGTSSKSVGIGVQKGLSTTKAKPKQPENLVLTHVIDGYVIQESPNPFPINGHSNGNDAEGAQKDKSSSGAKESTEDGKGLTNDSTKENTANNSVNKDNTISTTSTTNGLKVEQTVLSMNNTFTPSNTAVGKPGRVSVGCVNCGKKEMFKNGKDKMKKYCSAACNEAFAQKKALQNGTAPMSAMQTVMPKVMNQPMMANASIMPPMPAMPVAAMPLLQPTQPMITSITIPMPMNNVVTNPTMAQMNGAIKRNNKDTSGSAPEKKARINSPLTVKNDAVKAAQQNGLNNIGITDSSSNKEDKSDMPELEGIWLPGGGKEPPTKWTVQDVYDFINNLEGCSGCADEFRLHEIDGQALMFINEEHIITILKMKLGPALKICRKIKDLKSAFNM